jgi:hypothetical protein
MIPSVGVVENWVWDETFRGSGESHACKPKTNDLPEHIAY